MPFARAGSIVLNYEVLGEAGPWVTLLPGGRRSMADIKHLAQLIAAKGFRVLIHDRRNTGLSGISMEGSGSEFEIWADDLCGLLKTLGIKSAACAGSSSGCRVSTILALRHPEMVEALVMMRITGGTFAVGRLSVRYYGKFIEAAQSGGMAAVCDVDDFKTLVDLVPARKAELLAWDVGHFVATMKRWQADLEGDIGKPILGATVSDLKSLRCPVCILPGNDKTHSLAIGRLVHEIVSHSELHELRSDQLDLDLIPMSKWVPDSKLAEVIVGFLNRSLIAAQ